MPEKILIADDDLDTLRLVGLLLQRKGYNIVAANNGSQAIEKALSEAPDLILLDVMMPDMNGFDVVRRLRAESTTRDIPIIMFTAKTQVEDKVSGFEAGADDFLTKPTHPAELMARVKAILSRTAQPEKPPAAEATTSAIERRGTVIGILAAKGGLGVTTLATNLGVIFYKYTGGNVIVADIRPGCGTLGLNLGFSNQMDFNNLLEKKPAKITRREVQKALKTHDSGIHLLLSSYKPSDARLITACEQFRVVSQHLAQLSDHLILDLGSSLFPATEQILDLCDKLVVVVEPTYNTITQTKALIDELNIKVLGMGQIIVVLNNRIRSEMNIPRKEAENKLGYTIPVVFTPVPELAYQAAKQFIPLVSLPLTNISIQQFKKLAELITGSPLKSSR